MREVMIEYNSVYRSDGLTDLKALGLSNKAYCM